MYSSFSTSMVSIQFPSYLKGLKSWMCSGERATPHIKKRQVLPKVLQLIFWLVKTWMAPKITWALPMKGYDKSICVSQNLKQK